MFYKHVLVFSCLPHDALFAGESLCCAGCVCVVIRLILLTIYIKDPLAFHTMTSRLLPQLACDLSFLLRTLLSMTV